ncbi:MAG: diguanylate cyclase [Thermodesulfobacteriota bacterium]
MATAEPERTSILIVDDDPLIRELLGTFVSSFGFNFAVAGDGVEAVQKMAEEEYGIVITDIMMPNMDGMELLKRIREGHPHTDVIVVTAYGGTFNYTDVIKAGASDFISKPFNVDELEAKLNRVLREQRLLRELKRLSIRDGLTDLYNRRYFDVKLWEEAHRAHRQQYDLFLVLVDVDRFKGYNDTFGHLAGDKVLRIIGEVFLQSTRENVDWSFRYGGDEFAAIITQANIQQLRVICSRLLTNYNRHQLLPTHLSVGVAHFDRRREHSWAEDMSDLINRADRALYLAKSQGGNRLVVDGEGEEGSQAEALVG